MRTRQDNLWELVAGPTIWSIYFLAVYVTAALICAKGDPAGGIAALRLAVLGLGAAALAAIGYAGIDAWRRWRHGAAELPPHDDDTALSRRQFLALATLLLCGLSFVATIFVALPALFFEGCR